jgi:hypothetical protein
MLDDAKDNPALCTSFTEAQRAQVTAFLGPIVNHALTAINERAPHITALDNRPRKTYSPDDPDVFFHYVAQAMLEDLIVMLQCHV